MRIAVDTLPRTGRTVELGLDRSWVRHAALAALEQEARSLSGTLEIRPPQRGMVEVAVALEAAAEVPCDRCGETSLYVLRMDAVLRYVPAAAASSDERELAEEELEVGWYEDGELDLEVILQEAIALELPARYTCADAQACDTRTEALLASSGPAESGHPGFAILKDLH